MLRRLCSPSMAHDTARVVRASSAPAHYVAHVESIVVSQTLASFIDQRLDNMAVLRRLHCALRDWPRPSRRFRLGGVVVASLPWRWSFTSPRRGRHCGTRLTLVRRRAARWLSDCKTNGLPRPWRPLRGAILGTRRRNAAAVHGGGSHSPPNAVCHRRFGGVSIKRLVDVWPPRTMPTDPWLRRNLIKRLLSG